MLGEGGYGLRSLYIFRVAGVESVSGVGLDGCIGDCLMKSMFSLLYGKIEQN
jgi:hypothetical protein